MINKKGFSLVEMLVAMAVFVMFTGVLITSYMGIVGSMRGAEDDRELYSEARNVFDVLVQEARKGTVYPGAVVSECNLYGFDLGDSIEFCSLDGTRKVEFAYRDESIYLSEYEKKQVQGLVKEDFVKVGENKIHSDDVAVTGFDFYVWPKKNPYSLEEVDVPSMFQPKVTFIAIFERPGAVVSLVVDEGSVDEGAISYDLQTTISLRTYN